jgi:glycosyltransferase involved in cell wall biosynthesis
MNEIIPKFSVIIPNFNNGATLERAILSVLSQTYRAHEIIVVDDGSTDHSREVVEAFGESVTYVYQPNGGVSKARNTGAEKSTGDWLAFLDADDSYHHDRLRLHAEWIAIEPTLDFLLADQEARTPEGGLLYSLMATTKFGKELLDQYNSPQRISLNKHNFRDLISDGFGEIRTLSVPREKFLSLGGFPTQHKIGEDLHFFIRLYASSDRAGVVPVVLATYFIYGDSAIRKNPVRSMELFVDALGSLSSELERASVDIRIGYAEKCRSARLSLAYAYLRTRQKKKAVFSVFPSFLSNPNLKNLKDIFSVWRGFSKTTF